MKIFGWGKKKRMLSSELENDSIFNSAAALFKKSDEAMFGEYVSTRQFQYSKKLLDMCAYACGFNRDLPLSEFAKTVFRDIKASYDKFEELWQPFLSWDKAVEYRKHLLSDVTKIGQVTVPYSIALELYFILQQKDALDYLDKSGYRFLDINGISIDAKKEFGFTGADSVSAFVKFLPTCFSIDDNKFIEMIASIYNQLQKDISEVMEKLWGCSHFDRLWDYQRKNVSFYPYVANKVVLEPDCYYQNWYALFTPLTSNLRTRTKELVIHLNGIIETSYYFTALASVFAYAYLALSDFRKLYRYKDVDKGTSVRESIKVTYGDKFEEELRNTFQLLL